MHEEVEDIESFEKLKLLLRKVGVRSAKPTNMFGGFLTAKEFTDAINRMAADHGKPDIIIMNPMDLKALRKI